MQPTRRDGRAARRAATLYDSLSEDSAGRVIRAFSSSFGLASRLLGEPVRTRVRNLYALVRVADEIVDNTDPHQIIEKRVRVHLKKTNLWIPC